MSAPHSVHLADEVGTFNPKCPDCTQAIIEHYKAEWAEKPVPGYRYPEDLMRKISGWEWANAFTQAPDKDNFGVQIGWFSRALQAGHDAGVKAQKEHIRKVLGL